ncbi:MAG TPA: lipase family protein [Gemmataceae bacterium]|nr:lipase family protein [Gemmataceae bacterium]
MALELIEDAKGDARNAQFLALASDLAYMPSAEAAEAFRTQLGLEARLISVGNTQVYIATNDDHIVVAFRGTESPATMDGLKDVLLTDAANLLIQPQGDLGTDFAAAGVAARWHEGFMRALGSIWDPLLEAVQAERQKNDRPIWITGHSLGGALALLAAWRFKRKVIPIHQIYTFGAPMVGNAETASAIDRELPERLFRYVNDQDPVPQLPTLSLLANSYRHPQKEILLGVAAAGEAAVTAGQFFQSWASKAADGVLHGTLIDEIWQGLQARVGAHALENYRNKVRQLLS